MSSNVSPALSVPLKADAPRALAAGSGSPVSADSSMIAAGEMTMPSTGITSPADQKRVADGDLRDRHIFDAMIEPSMGDARRAVNQRAQIAFGAADREVFQHIAAGIHQCNHRASKRLAEPQRSEHRQERNRVHAHAPGGKVAHDRIKKSHGHRHGRCKPELIGKRSVTGKARRGADRQAPDGDDDQGAPQHPIKVDGRFHQHKDRRNRR